MFWAQPWVRKNWSQTGKDQIDFSHDIYCQTLSLPVQSMLYSFYLLYSFCLLCSFYSQWWVRMSMLALISCWSHSFSGFSVESAECSWMLYTRLRVLSDGICPSGWIPCSKPLLSHRCVGKKILSETNAIGTVDLSHIKKCISIYRGTVVLYNMDSLPQNIVALVSSHVETMEVGEHFVEKRIVLVGRIYAYSTPKCPICGRLSVPTGHFFFQREQYHHKNCSSPLLVPQSLQETNPVKCWIKTSKKLCAE